MTPPANKSLPTKGKILALDIGTRRTGVAVSDIEQRIAFPRNEVEHSSVKELLASLAAIISKDQVVGILMGMPISLTGEETRQTALTKEMAKEIIKEFQLPSQFVDERLTSQEARRMLEGGRGAVDSVAAQFMLELYINTKNNN